MGITKPDYVLIVGQGRSGTNWLLDLLDLSQSTHCLNEPNELPTSPLFQLSSPVVAGTLGENFGDLWDPTIAAASMRMGERDRIGEHPKIYARKSIYPLASTLLSKRQLRKLFSIVVPGLDRSDWQVPTWFGNLEILRQALTVFKLNQVPAWAEWVLSNRPQALVVHIVRHPGGFLNSWRNRYLIHRELESVKSANEERLQQIAEKSTHWRELFGDICTMTVEESELWYWRYANEVIYNASCDRSNYILIIYENLVSNSLAIAEELYKACNLPWTEVVRKKVLESTVESGAIATAWQEKLSSQDIKLVEKVLHSSQMSPWWESLSQPSD